LFLRGNREKQELTAEPLREGEKRRETTRAGTAGSVTVSADGEIVRAQRE